MDVLLILTAGDQVPLALRDGTGYADGQWNLPSGKLEIGEDAITAVLRESAEEIGVRLHADEVRLVTTVHHRNPAGHARIGLVFTIEHDPDRHGEPVNAEPHKCAKIAWFPQDLLPTNTYPYTLTCVAAYRNREPLRLDGWR